MAPTCGTGATATQCDLHTNICCVQLDLVSRCVPKDGGACNSNEVAVGCLQACECPGPDGVCCGVDQGLVVQSACQSVPTGGHCQPYPQTDAGASAQFCKVSSECVNGDECIAQTCELGANLNICGLQNQKPFNCMPQQ